MAIKTFTAGSVLTASDTNTFLANSGLVYVKSQTVSGAGSGVASVTITDAFSATYDDYLITYTGGVLTADTNITCTIGGSGTNYYTSMIYGSFLGGGPANAAQNNATSVSWAGGGNSTVANVHLTVKQPFRAVPTEFYAPIRYGTVYGNNVTYHGNSTSYTSITFAPSGANLLSGVFTVYGYRKA